MRPEDLERLSVKYDRSNLDGPRGGLAQSLEVFVPEVHRLHRKILADLDAEQGGIGWWHPALDVQRSCLISNYLQQAVWSISYNLLEAGAHLLELAEWSGREARAVERAVQQDRGGELTFSIPAPASPIEELVQPMVDMHTGGLLRAVASTIDLVGTATIGVAGFKSDLKRSDWKDTQACIKLELESDGVHAGACNQIVGIAQDCGPAGWLEWARSYRGMLVHRARRREPRQLIPRPTIRLPAGGWAIRTELARHLLNSPEASEIEAWVARNFSTALQEDAEVTLNSLRDSVVRFSNSIAGVLCDIWDTRKGNPDRHPQPSEQWRKIKLGPRGPFAGYRPGSRPIGADALGLDALAITTLRASHVLDDKREATWGNVLDGQ